eukprot:6044187-Amphidinium_carterae.1
MKPLRVTRGTPGAHNWRAYTTTSEQRPHAFRHMALSGMCKCMGASKLRISPKPNSRASDNKSPVEETYSTHRQSACRDFEAIE